MGELYDIYKETRLKKAERDNSLQQKLSVKVGIERLCEKYLTSADQVFTFEVTSPRDLSYAVMCIEEEPLKSTYIITQINETSFEARLRTIDL